MLTRTEIIHRAGMLAVLCEDFEFKISKPATEKQVRWRQKQVSRTIPDALSQLALQSASRVEISWTLEEAVAEESAEINEEMPCSGEFDFNFFNTELTMLEGWEHAFTHWQQYRAEPQPFAYEALFPIYNTTTGDLVVTLLHGDDAGAVYYMDHEGGERDWVRLADSVEQFHETLARLWFPSVDWHDSLSKFYDEERRVISAEVPLAREFDAFIRAKHAEVTGGWESI